MKGTKQTKHCVSVDVRTFESIIYSGTFICAMLLAATLNIVHITIYVISILQTIAI